jgi:hypothetical protein
MLQPIKNGALSADLREIQAGFLFLKFAYKVLTNSPKSKRAAEATLVTT